MAAPLLPDRLWSIIGPLLPPVKPEGSRGRPPVGNREALTGILFVLKTGIPWEYLPVEMGCGSGMTCWRRLRDWQEAGVWDRLLHVLLQELAWANRHDATMVETMLDAVPPLQGPRGRPRRRPDKLHADKAYDHNRCRRECRDRNVIPRIARRGIEDSKRLGRYRWVVERTIAWISRFRRLTVRYERRADIHSAFSTLACALIIFKQAERFC